MAGEKENSTTNPQKNTKTNKELSRVISIACIAKHVVAYSSLSRSSAVVQNKWEVHKRSRIVTLGDMFLYEHEHSSLFRVGKYLLRAADQEVLRHKLTHFLVFSWGVVNQKNIE